MKGCGRNVPQNKMSWALVDRHGATGDRRNAASGEERDKWASRAEPKAQRVGTSGLGETLKGVFRRKGAKGGDAFIVIHDR